MEVREKGARLRAGAEALTLLSTPVSGQVLRALEPRSLPLIELRRALGSPPQTTMRGHLRALAEVGILERRRPQGFPGPAEYDLLPAGQEMIEVVGALEAWLADSPDGPIQLGSLGARSSTKALIEGWSSGIIRALAAKPLTLTEISQLISGLSYPSLDRRLSAMRLAGLIEPAPDARRGTPYAVTAWLRRAIAPLAAAAHWERRNLPSQTAPIRSIDIEAAFLLSLPLVRLGEEHSGACRLAVETASAAKHRWAGVVVEVESGRIVSCVTRLDSSVEASAVGTAAAWIKAVLTRDVSDLEFSGRRPTAVALSDGLHTALAP